MSPSRSSSSAARCCARTASRPRASPGSWSSSSPRSSGCSPTCSSARPTSAAAASPASSARWRGCPPSRRSSRHEGEAKAEADIEPRYKPLFRVGESISGFPPVGGNRGRLLGDSDDVIDHIVADIDAARDHVHICFYIWLADTQRPEGRRRAEARRRARRHLPGDGRRPRQPRHGPLRALAGHGGGRRPPRRGAADRLPAVAPAQGPDRHAQPPQDRGRSTTASPTAARNNCADAAFAIKPRFAPWVDAMMRFEGPIVRQNQHVFATDWMAHGKEDLSGLFAEPVETFERRLPRPGHRHRRHRPLLGDARDVRSR